METSEEEEEEEESSDSGEEEDDEWEWEETYTYTEWFPPDFWKVQGYDCGDGPGENYVDEWEEIESLNQMDSKELDFESPDFLTVIYLFITIGLFH